MTSFHGTIRQGLWVGALAVLFPSPWAAAAEPTQEPRRAESGPRPSPVPIPKPEAIDKAIRRGVAFLLERQNENGWWGSARNTKGLNIYAPRPGAHRAFRAGVTSLCLSALIETDEGRPEVARAIDRGEAWTFEHLPGLRRTSPRVYYATYNNWGHAYGIQALVRMLKRRPDDQERCRKIRELIEHQLGMLERFECIDGGWAYLDRNAHTKKPSGSSSSFTTATVLVALDEARRAGLTIPDRLVERAVASIRRQRKPDFSYCYGESSRYRPMRGINRPGGSLGRSQACNLAMRVWGDVEVTDSVLVVWLDRLFARNGWLDMGRKRPIPHESWFQVAGYFFYYGHYYAALCIEQLKLPERARHQDQLASVLLRLQERDGSWWDYPLYDYHQQYGTAFALMALVRCRRESLD